jgi:hypothetical protein
MRGARRPTSGGVLFAVRWSESGERNEADEPFSSVSWMHRFEEPFRWYFPPDSGLSRARQNLTPDRGELQPKTDIVAEATYRIVFRSAGMLTVNELR